MGGVASYCRPCALEASDLGSSCTSCPAGHYINRDSGTCHLCPSNTILKAHQPYGAQACVPCGPGTKNNKVPGSKWNSPGAETHMAPLKHPHPQPHTQVVVEDTNQEVSVGGESIAGGLVFPL